MGGCEGQACAAWEHVAWQLHPLRTQAPCVMQPIKAAAAAAHRIKVDLEQLEHIAAGVHGIGIHGVVGGLWVGKKLQGELR